MRDQAPVDLGSRPDLGGRPLLGARVDEPLAIVEIQLRPVLEEGHVGLPVALDRPDVLPVAVEAVAVDPGPAPDHVRDHVAPEVGPRIREPPVEGALAEHVDAHAGEVGLGLLRLLREVRDPSRVVHGQDPHPGGVGERHPADGQRGIGALAAVERHERLVVHLVDVIAGEDHHGVPGGLVEHVEVLEHGIRRPAVPVARLSPPDVGLQETHSAGVPVQVPRAPLADVIVERAGVVLGEHHHVVDGGVDAVAQREVDDPVLATEGDRRLGPLLRQDRQACTFTAGEDHREGRVHALILVTVGRGPGMRARGS